ncbi:MAG: biotin/lipoyl-binding protein [Candidatus Acidiferrales bacterium]
MTDATSPAPAESCAPAPAPAAAPKPPMAAKYTYGILILAFSFVLMPYLLWNATWFGKPLTDEQLTKALNDHEHARNIQHAFAQIEIRMEKGDPTVHQWYPQLVSLAHDPLAEIRLTDAWVMGQDPSIRDFRQALLGLLTDSSPMVQRNAALSLVRFRDASGRPQILAMLRPYEVDAPSDGVVKIRLKPGDALNPGTMVGKIVSGTESSEVRCEVPGSLHNWAVPDGAKVAKGDVLLYISPSPEMVWEALRALFMVGASEDGSSVAPYARGIEGMPPQIQQQATLTLTAIRDRNPAPPPASK